MYKFLNFFALICCVIWIVYDLSIEAIVVFLLTMALFFRDDIHGIIGKNLISLTPKSKLIRNLHNIKYSFIEEPYINPMILYDLNGWISDLGDQITSINILKSNRSNRYHGDIKKLNKDEKLSKYPIVSIEDKESPVLDFETNASYGYQYIACSFSGLHIVHFWNDTSGTLTFHNILLLTLSDDVSIDYSKKGLEKVDRFIIKKDWINTFRCTF